MRAIIQFQRTRITVALLTLCHCRQFGRFHLGSKKRMSFRVRQDCVSKGEVVPSTQPMNNAIIFPAYYWTVRILKPEYNLKSDDPISQNHNLVVITQIPSFIPLLVNKTAMRISVQQKVKLEVMRLRRVYWREVNNKKRKVGGI